jgi:hypothetical protein
MSLISGFGHAAEQFGEAAAGEVGSAVGSKVANATGLGQGGVSGPEGGVGLEQPPDDGSGGGSIDDGSGGGSVGGFSGVGGFNGGGFNGGGSVDDGSGGGSGATGSLQGQSDGITQDSNSGVASNQATSSAQSAQQDQSSLNSAANAQQTNQQNAAAANAQQAVSDESNQDEEQAQLNAALEKARDEEIKAAIGSMQ